LVPVIPPPGHLTAIPHWSVLMLFDRFAALEADMPTTAATDAMITAMNVLRIFSLLQMRGASARKIQMPNIIVHILWHAEDI
jgi:hypothetical protein